MSEIGRALVIAAGLLSGAIVVSATFGSDRYQLVPVSGATAYRLDGLTGDVVVCTPAFCRPLPTLVPRDAAAQPGRPAPGAPPPAQQAPAQQAPGPAADEAT